MSEVEKELVVEPEKELTSKKEQVKEEKTKKKKKSSIENQLESVQEELQSVKDKYYRNLAEMENFKKRMNEDLKKERKYAGITMADKLIDSLEVFDQALNMQTEDKNMMNFLYGFKMIKDMMFNALKDEGVVLVESKIGDDFDPNVHEAMDVEYDPKAKEHTILKIIKKGYKYKDRILRPAMVIINIKPDDDKEEIEQNNKENIEE